MKKFQFILSIFLLSSIIGFNTVNAQTLPSNLELPAGWEVTENWMHAFQENIGANTSKLWMAAQMDEGATLLTNANASGFIIMNTRSVEDYGNTEAISEAAIIEGNGTQLMPSSVVQAIGSLRYKVELRGTISGKRVHAERICLPSADGSSTIVILSVNAGPSNDFTFASGHTLAKNIEMQQTQSVTAAGK